LNVRRLHVPAFRNDTRGGRIIATVTVSPAEARAVALSLPEAVEQDHHGRPSFRVGGKIFATLWTDDRPLSGLSR
jgi:hypothetical protein